MTSERDPIAVYFDGIQCPVCHGHTLRERDFETVNSQRAGIYAAVVAYCGRQLVVGMVLAQNVSPYYADRPAWFLYHDTNLVCPRCENDPDQADRLAYRTSPLDETWLDLNCQCGMQTLVRVIARGIGRSEPPQVLPPDDRAPAMAEVLGRITEEDFFQIHNQPETIDRFFAQVYAVHHRKGKPAPVIPLPEGTRR